MQEEQVVQEQVQLAPLDVDELCAITKTAIDKKKGKFKKEKGIDPKNLERFLESMEKDVRKFAEEGQYAVIWDYGSINVPVHHVEEIARTFKERHNRLMVIANRGTRKIQAEWKPKRR